MKMGKGSRRNKWKISHFLLPFLFKRAYFAPPARFGVWGSRGQIFGKFAGGGSFGASPGEGGGMPRGNPLTQWIGNSPRLDE